VRHRISDEYGSRVLIDRWHKSDNLAVSIEFEGSVQTFILTKKKALTLAKKLEKWATREY